MNSNTWFKLSSLFNKHKRPTMPEERVSNEKAIPTTVAPLMPKITTRKSEAALPSPIATTTASPSTTISTPPTPTDSLKIGRMQLPKPNKSDDSVHSKDSVPLGQFLRYRMTRSDRRNYQRHRITRPFAPKYEIEWQENQWLQLDKSTNKQIEQMRRNGFTKIAIRRDASLKRHIEYNSPTDLDVLLEISFSDRSESGNQSKIEPTSHQLNRFSVRRTYWWRTNHGVAEAYLPDWVDSDLCCDATDAPSVLAATTNNYSRSSLSYSLNLQHPKMPDTPIVSQKSSFSQLQQHQQQHQQKQQQQEQDWSYKPLQYKNPPFLMDKPSLVMG
ncbi:hypothetical protein BD408DRAFT_419862 [Parasitella parasitica]|nr:hypothetical protein BD408DRAFT_419862 [Parasitella parasitica]